MGVTTHSGDGDQPMADGSSDPIVDPTSTNVDTNSASRLTPTPREVFVGLEKEMETVKEMGESFEEWDDYIILDTLSDDGFTTDEENERIISPEKKKEQKVSRQQLPCSTLASLFLPTPIPKSNYNRFQVSVSPNKGYACERSSTGGASHKNVLNHRIAT